MKKTFIYIISLVLWALFVGWLTAPYDAIYGAILGVLAGLLHTLVFVSIFPLKH